MTRDELIEALAAFEHERWADWQTWVHQQCRSLDGQAADEYGHGALLIPEDAVDGWERQIETAYADLSEREKQSDREQVARYWPLIVDFVCDWLEGDADHDVAERWMDEMGTREVMAAIRARREEMFRASAD